MSRFLQFPTTRPRGFAALHHSLARLGYPGGAGLVYPMAAAGPGAVMGPLPAAYYAIPVQAPSVYDYSQVQEDQPPTT